MDRLEAASDEAMTSTHCHSLLHSLVPARARSQASEWGVWGHDWVENLNDIHCVGHPEVTLSPQKERERERERKRVRDQRTLVPHSLPLPSPPTTPPLRCRRLQRLPSLRLEARRTRMARKQRRRSMGVIRHTARSKDSRRTCTCLGAVREVGTGVDVGEVEQGSGGNHNDGPAPACARLASARLAPASLVLDARQDAGEHATRRKVTLWCDSVIIQRLPHPLVPPGRAARTPPAVNDQAKARPQSVAEVAPGRICLTHASTLLCQEVLS